MKVSVDFYAQVMMCSAKFVECDGVWRAYIPEVPILHYTHPYSKSFVEARLEDMVYEWIQNALENELPTPTFTIELGDY
jgi:hypothetical protein